MASLLDPCKPTADFSKLQGRLSLPEKLGDVDFYPNGGAHQPGCNDVCMVGLCFEFNLWDLFSGSCSHSRAHQFYIESIFSAPLHERFVSESCDSWNHFEADDCHSHVEFLQMGEGLTGSLQSRLTDRPAYYLHTNANAPFSSNASIE